MLVTVGGARLPRRRLLRQARGDEFDVVALVDRDRLVERRQTSLMAQQVPGGDDPLPRGLELGPHVGDRRVEIELTALPQMEGADGREPLGGGEHEHRRVAIPRAGGGGIGNASPQVDDRFAVEANGHRSAHVAELAEVVLEGRSHGTETVVTRSPDVDLVRGSCVSLLAHPAKVAAQGAIPHPLRLGTLEWMATMQTGALIAGRYELGSLLGRGGMAAVYAGTDRRLRRDVAVKLLHPEMAARPDVRRRFEAEARAAAGLAHANVVAVFDTGEHDGVPFIVMERLPGTTLADVLCDAPVDPRRVRGIAGDVLGALGAAHAAGIVHRDVKPGNILICDDGRAKVADFGIATRVDADPTSAGHLIGTPAYLAPERLAGDAASPRSDLYSLGVVLYEALAGTKPFTGDPPLAVAHAIQQGTYASLGEVRPGLDPRLVDAVERAMAREPAERFASAAAMAAALEPVGDATQVLPVAAGCADGDARAAPQPMVGGARGGRAPRNRDRRRDHRGARRCAGPHPND